MKSDKQISELLLFSKKLRDNYDKKIEEISLEIGLTKPEADMLLFLFNNPELNTAKDAVMYRGFSKAYVSKALTLLSEKKFIILEKDVVDKRFQHIYIKEEARNKVKILKNTQEEIHNSYMKNVTEKEKEILGKIVSKIFENVKGEYNV